MKLRKFIFWTHLAVGLAAGLIVFVLSVTGVLLAYERQLTAWADRGFSIAAPAVQPAPASLREIVQSANRLEPKLAPTAVVLKSEVTAPVAVSFGRERTLFFHPHSGELLGVGASGIRTFFQRTLGLHRWLTLTGARHDTGRAITGACNLGFLFLVVSGFYLWWPRSWSPQALRAVIFPSSQLRGKARDFNWHNSLGFWSAPVLLVVVGTGVIISYTWAGNLLYRASGTTPPPARAPEMRPRTPAGPPAALQLPATFDSLVEQARQQVAGWRTINLRLPPGKDGALSFTIDSGHGGRPDLRSQLTLAADGKIQQWEPFASTPRGRQLRSWARFLHTGEAGGIIGQTLAALASAAGAVLVWTGFALSWRRFRNRRGGPAGTNAVDPRRAGETDQAAAVITPPQRHA
ncbi:MAG TPA: PepSY-associated TM helix domain-containing protein [Chthoniobacteraceae bacterium]|jgi:uncharacterized iron-regulated membrane protein